VRLPIHQLDAFTSRLFGGNPAAVVLLDEMLPDHILQAIATENNLSETAFLLPRGDSYGLRWFTPSLEIDLCGHATLASAAVLFAAGRVQGDSIDFDTLSGRLTVTRSGDLLSLDFPARPPKAVPHPDGLTEALGARPSEVLAAVRDLLVVFETEAEVSALRPNFEKVAALDTFAVIVTAPGREVDFVSRFFAPKAGVAEDPVTGSAHCTLIPYWAERLGKEKLSALQVSRRGGELVCENRGERVTISGRAVEYLRGEINVEPGESGASRR
jgi:PhzF family phenazine biosynthesis protein